MVVVLGVEWLIQLGTYASNLQEQFMEFKWKKKKYKLYGSQIQNHVLNKFTNLTLPLQTSPINNQKQIKNQYDSLQWKMKPSMNSLRTKNK